MTMKEDILYRKIKLMENNISRLVECLKLIKKNDLKKLKCESVEEINICLKMVKETK